MNHIQPETMTIDVLVKLRITRSNVKSFVKEFPNRNRGIGPMSIKKLQMR